MYGMNTYPKEKVGGGRENARKAKQAKQAKQSKQKTNGNDPANHPQVPSTPY